MDPITGLTLATQVVGLGLSIFGGASSASDAKHAAQIQSNIAGLEGGLEDQRHTAMELAARRNSLEVLRANQRARSTAINNATNQGAQFGSGLQGGLAQVQDQGLFNLAGVNQNLEIGEAMFGINKQITGQKQQLTQVQGQQATDQGIASLGGALVKSGPMLGSIGSSIGAGASNYASLMGPGSLSGGRGTT